MGFIISMFNFKFITCLTGSKIQQLFDDKNTALEMVMICCEFLSENLLQFYIKNRFSFTFLCPLKNKRLQRELDEARTTISNTPNPPSSSSSSSSPNLTGDNLNPLEGK